MRAAIFSAGGVLAAIQVGAIRNLVKQEPQLQYDLYAGTSSGAINALFMSMDFQRDLVYQAAILESNWRTLSGDSSVYNNRVPAFLRFFVKGSLHCTKPLENFLRELFCLQSLWRAGLPLYIGITRLGGFEYQEKDCRGIEDPVNLVLASCAIPGLFPPKRVEGLLSIDGGISHIFPHQFLEAHPEVTELDIYLARGAGENNKDQKVWGNKVLARLFGSGYSDSLMKTLLNLKELARPGLKIRIIAPDYTPQANPLCFDPELINCLIEVGKRARPMSLEKYLGSIKT